MFQRPGPRWKAIGKLDLIMPVLPRPWSTKSNRSPIFSRVSRPTLKLLLTDSVGAPEWPLSAQSRHWVVHRTCPLSGVKWTWPIALHLGFGKDFVRPRRPISPASAEAQRTSIRKLRPIAQPKIAAPEETPQGEIEIRHRP